MKDLDRFLQGARSGLQRQAHSGGKPDFAAMMERTRSLTESSDSTDQVDVASWVADTRAAWDREWSTTPGRPDFDDVMDRVERGAASDGGPEVATVVEMRRPDATMLAAEDGAVDAVIADTRAVVEREVEARRRPTPNGRLEEETARTGVRTPRGSVVGMLLAAAGLLGVCSLAAPRVFDASIDDAMPEQAVHSSAELDDGGVAQIRKRSVSARPATAPPSVPRPPVEPVPEPIPEPTPALGAAPADLPSEDLPDAARTRPRPAKARRGSAGVDLRTMAERADQRWKGGDLDEARALLLQIVRRGGRSQQAEMAYADLFTLAKQRKDRRGRTRLFRGYLRKFPQGRFAEDARAGLCRVVADAQRAKCWNDYRRMHPQGAYLWESTRE